MGVVPGADPPPFSQASVRRRGIGRGAAGIPAPAEQYQGASTAALFRWSAPVWEGSVYI